jgi:hypothetical protein
MTEPKVYCKGCRWCGEFNDDGYTNCYHRDNYCPSVSGNSDIITKNKDRGSYGLELLPLKLTHPGYISVDNKNNDCPLYAKRPWWMVWREEV